MSNELELFRDDEKHKINRFLTIPAKKKRAITKNWNSLNESIPVEYGFNTAVLTGVKSNITVLDIDIPKEGESRGLDLIEMFKLENHYSVSTPSGGLHIYFNYVDNIKNKVRVSINGVVYSADIRNDNGYILAPPSEDYRLLNDVEITDMPKELVDFLKDKPKSKQKNTIKVSDSDIWAIFQKEKPNIAKSFKMLKYNNGIINTKRLEPSYCDICKRTHDNDNTLFLTVQEDKLFRGCIRNPHICKYVHELESYDEKKKYKVQLPTKEQVDNQKSKIYDMIKSASDKLYDISTKWLSNCHSLMKRFTDDDTEGVTAVKSEKGTGKTWTLAQEWKKPEYENKRIQIATFRVSLANNYKLEFKEFKHYQEYDKLSINDKNIICIDSLYKLDQRKDPKDKWSNDILYIDEISQVRLHQTSKTYLKQPRFEQNLKALINLIKNSKHIIITDANISAEDINWINEIRGQNKGETYTFNNDFINEDKKRTFKHIKKAEIINSIINDVKANKPAYVASNHSVDSINELERQIILATKIDPSRILTIHSHNQNNEAQRKFILDPNEELKANDYLVIITSPCIQSGFNISLSNYIHNIYGLFCNSTNSPNDADQMLGRVRNPINTVINYSFKNTNRNIGPTTESDYKKYIIANTHARIDEMDEQIYGRIQGDYNEHGQYEIFNSSLLKLICKNKAYENKQLLRWHEIFIMRQLVAGHKVILDDDKTETKISADIKETAIQAKAEIKEEKAELLNSVKSATDEEIKEFKSIINQGGNLTDIQQAQQEKHFLLNIYAMEKEPDNKEWYLEYNDKKKMKAYRAQKKIFSITEEKGDLQEALKSIKISDIYKLKGQNLGEEGPKELLQRTADLATANLQAAKIELLFKWLKIFNITNNLYTRDLEEDNVYNGLNRIHKEFLTGEMLNESVSILGKNKKRTANIGTIEYTDKKFTRKVLDFINGSFNELLGVKIKNASRNGKRADYQFKNDYLDDGIFTVQKIDDRPYYYHTDHDEYENMKCDNSDINIILEMDN